MVSSSEKKQIVVRKVWAWNLESEFALISKILPRYPYAAIDTEFPGFVYSPGVKCHYSKLPPFYNYQLMKANVDALNIIQLGLTLSDCYGSLPDLGTDSCFVWEFNFMDFDMKRHLFDPESIRLLQDQGIDFAKNRAEGVPSWAFRRLFLGLLSYRYPVTWVTFHGCYDFGYLIKILTAAKLPPHIVPFRCLVSHFFGPRVYDMKHMMRFCRGLYGGLENLAKTLNVDRVAGKSHQAGSDSLLTMQTFIKLREVYFSGKSHGENVIISQFQRVLYGLEPAHPCKQVPYSLIFV